MKRSIACALVALLAGCGTHGFAGAATKASQTASAMGGHVVILPGGQGLIIEPDMGVTPIVDAIQGAQKSIHMEMYLLMPGGVDQAVLDALVAKAKAGTDVSIILDGFTNNFPQPPSCEPPANPVRMNQPAFDALTAAGAHVKWSSPQFHFTHQKSMVIDGQRALIMTLNCSTSAFTKNREYAVVTEVDADVADTEKIFQADWTGTTYQQADPALVVSPTSSRRQVLDLIDSAKQSISLEVEFLTDKDVATHLGARARAGVNVTTLMSFQAVDPCSGSDANTREAKLLQGLGVKNVGFSKRYTMHAKAILADGQRAYIGSENFTANSLDNNRELGIITHDPNVIVPLARTMASDWTNQAPVAAEMLAALDPTALLDALAAN